MVAQPCGSGVSEAITTDSLCHDGRDMTTRRTRSERVHLQVQVHGDGDEPENDDVLTRFPWPMTAFAAGVLAVVTTWLVVTIPALGLWVIDRTAPFAEAVQMATRVWIAAHGGGLQVGRSLWTVVPLGVTITFIPIVWFLTRRAALVVAEQTEEAAEPERLRFALKCAGLVIMAYTMGVVAISAATGVTERWGIVLAHGLGVSVLGAWPGVMRPFRVFVLDRLPWWAQPVPMAMVRSWGVTFVGGVVAVATTFVQQWPRVIALQDELGFTGAGVAAAWVTQAAFWVNLVLWGVSWVLGAGIRLGAQSVLTPVGTDIGFLPAIPVFGAVPPEGPHHEGLMLWLVVGVLAGAVAAISVLRSLPHARCDETAVVGGLSGVLGGLLVVATAMLSGGDLGTGNLTGLGPRGIELLVLAPAIMGLSGLTVGLVWGLVRMSRMRRAEQKAESGEGSDTTGPSAGSGDIDSNDGDGDSSDEDDAPTSETEDSGVWDRLDAEDPQINEEPTVDVEEGAVEEGAVEEGAVEEGVADEGEEPTNPRLGPVQRPEQ